MYHDLSEVTLDYCQTVCQYFNMSIGFNMEALSKVSQLYVPIEAKLHSNIFSFMSRTELNSLL